MQVFYTEADIEDCLTDAFLKRYRSYRLKDVALTGILLARPEDKITNEAILPHLEYWHYRSDLYTDFFCAGYTPTQLVSDAKPVGVKIAGQEWGFSMRAFVELVEQIEKQTGWRYNGDPCLLLTNAYFDGAKAHLDFKRSIRINVRQALEEKAISTPTDVANSVFDFAKYVNEDITDPIWELSDQFGRKLIKKGLKDAFLAWLPSWVRPSAKAGFHFVVHEVRAGA
jgi:hypothetical protein